MSVTILTTETTGRGAVHYVDKVNGGFAQDVSTGLTNNYVAIVSGGAITIGPLTQAALPAAVNPNRSGLTLWATPAAGEIGYVTSTNKTLAKAIATALSTSYVYGVYEGTAGTVDINGVINLLFDTGLTLLSGQEIWLSPTTAGRATNVRPSTTGQCQVSLGILEDITGYGGGSALPVKWNPQLPILIVN